jgi:tRNA threonylcarbamoyladenosine biosynthesis protein TsaB
MILVALDASTEYGSVALLDGDRLSRRGRLLGRGHAEHLLPMVDELLSEAGLPARALECVAFGRGPGAFTGLRIAAGVAQGLAFAAGCPVVPVSSLAAVAAQVEAGPGERVLICNDARMGEVYWAVYLIDADGRPTAQTAEQVSAPQAVGLQAGAEAAHAAGNALSAVAGLRDRLSTAGLRIHDGLWPEAAAIAKLATVEFTAGRALPAAEARPVYVRDDVVGRRVTPVS